MVCDYNEFIDIPGINQIFGHTPNPNVRYQKIKNPEHYCIDTKLNHYTVYQEGIMQVTKVSRRNNANFHSTRRNIGITPNKKKYTHVLLAYLRSSHFARYLEKNGHSHGGGVLEIRVTDYRNALVPDFDKMTNMDIIKMGNAWQTYKNDLDQEKLDDIVFKILGFTTHDQDEIKKELEILIKQRIESKKSK